MTKYQVKIKDNSCPEYMQFEGMITEFDATIEVVDDTKQAIEVELKELIEGYAYELNTIEESIEILSITKIEE